jgi:hypothetical protein
MAGRRKITIIILDEAGNPRDLGIEAPRCQVCGEPFTVLDAKRGPVSHACKDPHGRT